MHSSTEFPPASLRSWCCCPLRPAVRSGRGRTERRRIRPKRLRQTAPLRRLPPAMAAARNGRGLGEPTDEERAGVEANIPGIDAPGKGCFEDWGTLSAGTWTSDSEEG